MCSLWVLIVTGLMPCTICGGRRSWARRTRHSTRKRRRPSERGGGLAMTFEELLDQAIALLQRRGRLTYRALKRQFNIDDDYLEDLKAELIQGQRLDELDGEPEIIAKVEQGMRRIDELETYIPAIR